MFQVEDIEEKSISRKNTTNSRNVHHVPDKSTRHSQNSTFVLTPQQTARHTSISFSYVKKTRLWRHGRSLFQQFLNTHQLQDGRGGQEAMPPEWRFLSSGYVAAIRIAATVVRDIEAEGAESTRIAATFQVHHTENCVFTLAFTLHARTSRGKAARGMTPRNDVLACIPDKMALGAVIWRAR